MKNMLSETQPYFNTIESKLSKRGVKVITKDIKKVIKHPDCYIKNVDDTFYLYFYDGLPDNFAITTISDQLMGDINISIAFLSVIKRAVHKQKMVDVTNMDYKGLGYRIINKPTPAKNKKWIDGIPIISETFGAYNNALMILGPQYASLAREFYDKYGIDKNPIIEIKTPISKKVIKYTKKIQPYNGFTGLQELDEEILLNLDIQTLYIITNINKYIKSLITENFWCRWIEKFIGINLPHKYTNYKMIAKNLQKDRDYDNNIHIASLIDDKKYDFIKFCMNFGLIEFEKLVKLTINRNDSKIMEVLLETDLDIMNKHYLIHEVFRHKKKMMYKKIMLHPTMNNIDPQFFMHVLDRELFTDQFSDITWIIEILLQNKVITEILSGVHSFTRYDHIHYLKKLLNDEIICDINNLCEDCKSSKIYEQPYTNQFLYLHKLLLCTLNDGQYALMLKIIENFCIKDNVKFIIIAKQIKIGDYRAASLLLKTILDNIYETK